jgi:hypothetical protein
MATISSAKLRHVNLSRRSNEPARIAALLKRPDRMKQLKRRDFCSAILRKKMCGDQQYRAEHSGEQGAYELVDATQCVVVLSAVKPIVQLVRPAIVPTFGKKWQ